MRLTLAQQRDLLRGQLILALKWLDNIDAANRGEEIMFLTIPDNWGGRIAMRRVLDQTNPALKHGAK